jgi:hypothetical protein
MLVLPVINVSVIPLLHANKLFSKVATLFAGIIMVPSLIFGGDKQSCWYRNYLSNGCTQQETNNTAVIHAV